MFKPATHWLSSSTVICSLLLCSAPAQADSNETWKRIGDVGTGAVPLAALGITVAKQDWQGLGQFALGYGTTALATKAGKSWVPKERPDGSNDRSFISGHASAAFAGAAFLHHRYGWHYGAPAYAAAALTGYTRVKTDKHHPEDVLLGAALAMGVSYLVTSEYQESSFVMTPILNQEQVGLSVNMVF